MTAIFVNLLPLRIRRIRWMLLPLAILFMLFILFNSQSSLAQSTATCDIEDTDYEGPGTLFLCRVVPDYFINNVKAKIRTVEEIKRRKKREEAGGARFEMPALSGYRCPDAQGECPNVWIPSPGGVRGLSKPNSFAGSSVDRTPGAYIQRISGSGIGDQSIINQNPIDAIDIWGPGAESGSRVCFLGTGRILYVDTDAMPRTNDDLTTEVEGERTCADVPGRGQVIFLPLSG